mgnify:CR=1 FL=1
MRVFLESLPARQIDAVVLLDSQDWMAPDEIRALWDAIDRAGKDISGTGMDPNVTGRFWVHGLPEVDAPKIATIVLHDITPVSGGNLLGIGLADFIPASLAAQMAKVHTIARGVVSRGVGASCAAARACSKSSTTTSTRARSK